MKAAIKIPNTYISSTIYVRDTIGYNGLSNFISGYSSHSKSRTAVRYATLPASAVRLITDGLAAAKAEARREAAIEAISVYVTWYRTSLARTA